jgi:hypothetical protein
VRLTDRSRADGTAARARPAAGSRSQAVPGPPAAAAGPEHEGPSHDPAADPVVLRVLSGLLIAVAAIGLAVIESFLVPLHIGSVPFPITVLLAVAGNVVLARLAGRQTGSILAAAAVPLLWLLVVIVLSLPRAEGDLIVPGSPTGLVFLFAGAVAGAFGVASEITRRAGAAARTRR